jgi:TonB family protein
MTIRERFGKFVLLEELVSVPLGIEFRAAKIGSGGFERFVRLLRLTPRALPSAEASQSLVREIKYAAQIHHPSLARVFGMGTIRGHPYIAYDYIEGRSLLDVLRRSKSSMLPMSFEQALLIATRIREALEQIHHRKTDSGARYCHGYLHPSTVLISFEGDVRLQGLGYWPSGLVRAMGFGEATTPYLAPEQRDERGAETRSDIYALGCLLFEMLVGEPLFTQGVSDLEQRLASARIRTSMLEEIALPSAVIEMLRKSTAADPADRFAHAKELHKPLESMLFSSGSSATTFNLAFYMHSLFDKEIERETNALIDDKASDFSEFLRAEEKPLVTAPSVQSTVALPRSTPPPTVAPRSYTAAPHSQPAASDRRLSSTPSVRTPAVKRAPISDFAFEIPASRPHAPILIGVGFAILTLALLTWFAVMPRSPDASSPRESTSMTHNSEVARLEKRIRELEQQLRDSQEEEQNARQAIPTDGTPAFAGANARSALPSRTPNPAQQRKRDELRRTYQAERRRLEELKRAAEQRRALEPASETDERSPTNAASSAVTVPSQDAPPTPAATSTSPPPTSTPSSATPHAPTTFSLDDPGVIPPTLRSQSPAKYPHLARLRRVEGEVVLNCVVDERGRVISARVVKGHKMLRDEALRQINSRRYSPATRYGERVRIRFTTRVVFQLSE